VIVTLSRSLVPSLRATLVLKLFLVASPCFSVL